MGRACDCNMSELSTTYMYQVLLERAESNFAPSCSMRPNVARTYHLYKILYTSSPIARLLVKPGLSIPSKLMKLSKPSSLAM